MEKRSRFIISSALSSFNSAVHDSLWLSKDRGLVMQHVQTAIPEGAIAVPMFVHDFTRRDASDPYLKPGMPGLDKWLEKPQEEPKINMAA